MSDRKVRDELLKSSLKSGRSIPTEDPGRGLARTVLWTLLVASVTLNAVFFRAHQELAADNRDMRLFIDGITTNLMEIMEPDPNKPKEEVR